MVTILLSLSGIFPNQRPLAPLRGWHQHDGHVRLSHYGRGNAVCSSGVRGRADHEQRPFALSESAEPPGRVVRVEDEVNGRHGVERAKRGPQEIPERTPWVAIMISPAFGGITTWTSSRRVPSAMAKRAAVRAAAADRSESSMPQMVNPPRLVAIDR
jgi:hypothetical protein